MKYEKPYLTFDEQADMLAKRGLSGSRDALLQCLRSVGYYRMSGYWHIFQKNNAFVEGTAIEDVIEIYCFDRQLRLVVLDAIERVEVYFRTQLAHKLSRDFGAFGYQNPEGLPRLDKKRYQDFIDKCHVTFDRSREPFVLHYKEKYSDGDESALPPYWMMVNAMDFGQVVTLYKGAPVGIRREIAEELGQKAPVIESWLLSINTVRNICAHHGRLWNRTIGTKPRIPKDSDWHTPYEVSADKVFCTLVILQYLVERIVPQSGWRNRLDALFDSYPNIDKTKMGFKEGYEKCPVWNHPAAVRTDGSTVLNPEE